MEVYDCQEDAFYRIPLLFLLDALIEKSFYPFIPVQDMLAVPIIIVCIFFFLLLTTLRNVTLKSVYLTLFSVACVRLTHDFFSAYVRNSEIMSQHFSESESVASSASLIVDWLRLCFVQLCAGYVLMVSYLSNPMLESNFSPRYFTFVFLPPLLLNRSFSVPLISLYYLIVPFIPLFIVMWKGGPELLNKVKAVHHLSSLNGHVDFVIEYLFFNINLKLIRRMLIYYWTLNQVTGTLSVLLSRGDIGQPETQQQQQQNIVWPISSLNSTQFRSAAEQGTNEAAAADDETAFNEVASALLRCWVLNCTKSWVAVASASAVLTRVGVVLDRVLVFVLETRNPDEDFPTYCALLYMITSLQSNLSFLSQAEQYDRFMRNLVIVLIGIVHFAHMSSETVVETMGATNNRKLCRHIKVWLLFFMELSISSCILREQVKASWNAWNISVAIFCAEVIFKVSMLIVVYLFFYSKDFMAHKLNCDLDQDQDFDDILSNIKLFTSCIVMIFGVTLFFNGLYVLIFEWGGKFRALMLGLHAYSNIFLECRKGWKKFQLRRTAWKKLENLEVVDFKKCKKKKAACESNESERIECDWRRGELDRRKPVDSYSVDANEYDDDDENLCPICFYNLEVALKTQCGHHFHRNCIRKWIYVQDFCPLCKAKLNI